MIKDLIKHADNINMSSPESWSEPKDKVMAKKSTTLSYWDLEQLEEEAHMHVCGGIQIVCVNTVIYYGTSVKTLSDLEHY